MKILLICGALLAFGPASPGQTAFVHANGKQLMGTDGKPLLLRGINLGNWFLSARVSIALSLVLGLPSFAASVPGIHNFDQVDAHVYRGGQPTGQGFQYLSRLGVKTVIDLREPGERSREEERVVTGAGMKYVNVPMTGLTPPTDAEISRILATLEDGAAGPVFVHCRRGADRTGAVIAAYHIDHDRWDNVRALVDAKAHKMSFFQHPRENFIEDFRPLRVDAKSASPSESNPRNSAAATSGLARPTD